LLWAVGLRVVHDKKVALCVEGPVLDNWVRPRVPCALHCTANVRVQRWMQVMVIVMVSGGWCVVSTCVGPEHFTAQQCERAAMQVMVAVVM
jgi:hypothetical protein